MCKLTKYQDCGHWQQAKKAHCKKSLHLAEHVLITKNSLTLMVCRRDRKWEHRSLLFVAYSNVHHDSLLHFFRAFSFFCRLTKWAKKKVFTEYCITCVCVLVIKENSSSQKMYYKLLLIILYLNDASSFVIKKIKNEWWKKMIQSRRNLKISHEMRHAHVNDCKIKVTLPRLNELDGILLALLMQWDNNYSCEFRFFGGKLFFFC